MWVHALIGLLVIFGPWHVDSSCIPLTLDQLSENIVASGIYTTSVFDCQRECSRVPMDYSAISNGICFCGASFVGAPVSDALCTYNCLDSQPCGALYYANVYPKVEIIDGLALAANQTLAETYTSSVGIVSSATQYAGSLNLTMKWGDSTSQYVATAFGTATHTFVNYGLHEVSMVAIDDVASAIQTVAVTVVTPATTPTLLIPEVIEIYSERYVKFQMDMGSNVEASIDFNDGSSDTMNQPVDAYQLRHGIDLTTSGTTGSAGVFILTEHPILYNGTITGLRINVLTAGNFNIQVFRPQCELGTVFCLQQKTCIPLDATCAFSSASPLKKIHTTCVNGTSVFSMVQGLCVNNLDPYAEIPQVLVDGATANVTYYKYISEATLTATSTGISDVPLDVSSFLKVEAGDLITVNAGTGSYKFEATEKSLTLDTSPPDYATRNTAPFLVSMPSMTVNSFSPMVMINTVKASVNAFPHNYTTHTCPNTPPVCPLEKMVFPVVTIFNQQLGSGKSVNGTARYYVQTPISNVSFIHPTILSTVTPINFTIVAHPGTTPIYFWTFGDGYNTTTNDTWTTHPYLTNGTYNVTVEASNLLNSMTFTVTIYVYESVGNFGFDIDKLVYTPMSTVNFKLLISQGSDLNITITTVGSDTSVSYNGDPGTSPWSNVTSMNFFPYSYAAQTLSNNIQAISGITEEVCSTKCITTDNCYGYEFSTVCTLILEDPYKNTGTFLYGSGNLHLMLGSFADPLCRFNQIFHRTDLVITASSAITGSIPDISVVSVAGTGWQPSSTNTVGEYVMIQFPELTNIYQIRTQGSATNAASNMNVDYSLDNLAWDSLTTITSDVSASVVVTTPVNGVTLRFIRFTATAVNPGLKVELSGCSAANLKYTDTVSFTDDNFIQYLNVTVSNNISSIIRSLLVRNELPIDGFNVVTLSAYADDVGGIIDMLFLNGTNMEVNSTFNLTHTNFTQITTGLNTTFVLTPAMLQTYGDFPFTVTTDNYASNAVTINKTIVIDYTLVNVSVNTDSIFVNRTAVATFHLFVGRGSRFNVTVNYQDGTPNYSGFFNEWYTSSGFIDISHSFANVGVYLVEVNVVNSLGSWNTTTIIYVLNPVLPTTTSFNIPATVLMPFNSAGEMIGALTFTGLIADLPTNVSINLNYGDGTSALESVVWPANNVASQHRYNYTNFGQYTLTLNVSNAVSSFVTSFIVEVDQELLGLAIVSNKYASAVGDAVTFTLTRTWGSRVKYFMIYKDDQTETLSPPVTDYFNITHAHIYNVNKTLIPTVIATNFVSNVTFALSQVLSIEYGVQNAFTLVGIDKIMLLRPSNQTVQPNSYYVLCMNTLYFTNYHPTNVSYTVDFGDDTNIGNDSAQCLPKSSYTQAEASLCDAFVNTTFCRLLVPHAYNRPSVFNTTVYLYNKISSTYLHYEHRVFSEIIQPDQTVNLNPAYGPGDPAVGKSPIYPLEKPIYFNVTTSFGHEMPLIYEWNMDDGTALMTTTYPFYSYTFKHPGTYNVSVKIYNPMDYEIISNVFTIYRSVLDLKIAILTAYPMLTPYTIPLQIGSLGTKACYVLDLTSFGSKVMNQSKVAFGDPNICGLSLMPYHQADITAEINSVINATFTGGTIKYFKEWVTMMNYYGKANITFRGFNHISDVTTTFLLVVTKGPCSYPTTNLLAGGGNPKKFRRNKLSINSMMQIKCFNITTEVQWSIKKLVGTVWVDAVPDLKSFYLSHPSWIANDSSIVTNIDNQMQGIMNTKIGNNTYLQHFLLPKYALSFSTQYKINIYVVMVEETDLYVHDEFIFTVERGKLVPCLGVQNPLNYKFERDITFNAACTYDEDVFYEGGETDNIQFEWWCNRQCESISFGPDYTYNQASQSSVCNNVGCFNKNATKSAGTQLPYITKDNWDDILTNPLTKEAYDALRWADPTFNGTKELYSFLNAKKTQLYLRTENMEEFGMSTFSMVIKSPGRTSQILRQYFHLLPGDPPEMELNCISNCGRGLTNSASDLPIIKVDRFAPFKLQTTVTNRLWGAIYVFRWCLSTPLVGIPEEFQYSNLTTYMDQIICARTWYTTTSTGRDESGLAFDVFPTFGPPSGSSEFLVLRMEAYRTSNPLAVGIALNLFTINTPPDISNLVVETQPNTGYSMETSYKFMCSGAVDDEKPLRYSIGFSTVVDKTLVDESSCVWLVLDSYACSTSGILPAGKVENDYDLTFCLQITDSIDMSIYYFDYKFKVQPMRTDLDSVLGPDSSAFKDLENLATGSPDAYSSAAISMFSVLNTATSSTDADSMTTGGIDSSIPLSEEELYEQEQARTEQLKKIRTAMFNTMATAMTPAAVAGADVSRLKTLAYTVSQGCNVPDQMSSSTVDIASNIGTILVDAISIQANSQSVTSSDIVKCGTSVAGIIGNILMTQRKMDPPPGNLSLITTPSPSNEDIQRHKDIVDATRNMTRRLFFGASKKVVVGEKQMEMVSPAMSLAINRRNPDDFFERPPITTGFKDDCSTFKMKGGGNLFEETDVVDPTLKQKSSVVKSFVTALAQNPVQWSNASANISSRVASLEFASIDDTFYAVDSETSNDTDIELWVDSLTSAAEPEYAYAQTLVAPEGMWSHAVYVRESNALFITLERFLNMTMGLHNVTVNGSMVEEDFTFLANNDTYTHGDFYFQVFIREGEYPKDDEYDHYCELPRLVSQCEEETEEDEIVSDLNDIVSFNSTTDGMTVTEMLAENQDWFLMFCECTSSGICSMVGNTTTTTPDSNTTESNENQLVCYCNQNGVCVDSTKLTTDVQTSTEAVTISPCEAKKGESVVDKDLGLWTCFFDAETLNTTFNGKQMFIGVRAIKRNETNTTMSTTEKTMTTTENPSKELAEELYAVVDYTALIRSTGCYFLNETTNELETGGCRVGPCSTLQSTQCRCGHLTSFSSSVFVPPIQIDPNNSAFANLDSNPIAFALCIALVCFWFIVVVWARKRDKDDLDKAGVTPLPCNDPRDQFAYEVTVWTGRRRNAGTTAEVTVVMSGEDSETDPRVLRDNTRHILQRTSIDSFLVTTPEHLGNLTHLRVYHDNQGASPGWYLSRVLVTDVTTGNNYYFLINRWLNLDEDDGMIDRIIPVAGKEEINGFDNVFWTRTSKNFFDGHLWFSVVTRPPRSKFTRVQRATCCLVLLMFTLMVNLMFYGQADKVDSPALLVLGPVKISLQSIYLATVSALIVIPINIVIVLLFRNRRDRVLPKVMPQPQPHGANHDSQKSDLVRDIAHIDTVMMPSTSGPHTGNYSRPVTAANIELGSITPEPMTGAPSQITESTIALDRTGKYKKKDKRSLIQKAFGGFMRVYNRIFPLPWWTYIIGYMLSFLCVCVCTYLMVEFAGVLGEEKTSEWLASISISLLQSILIIQPVKIMVIVLLYALIIRSPDEDVDEVSKEMMLMGMSKRHEVTTIDDLRDPNKLHQLQKLKKAARPPPDDGLLEEIRAKRQKDKEMQLVVQDCAFYCVFLLVLMAFAYSNQDFRTFYQNDGVRSMMMEGSYNDGDGVSSLLSAMYLEDIYSYINHTFIPALYPDSCYNGQNCDLLSGTWTSDLQLYRLRQAQIRQVRIKQPGDCKVPSQMQWLTKRCREEYSLFSEDEETYNPMWQPFNKSTDTELKPWTFTSAMDLYGFPVDGILGSYGGGGYVAELGNSKAEAQAILTDLQNNFWLDPFTRGIYFEFLVYNVGTNLYTTSVVLAEQFIGGGFQFYPKYYTLRLNRYYGTSFVVYATIDALAGLLILWFVIREIKEFKRIGKAYFKDFWNVMDFFLIIITFVEIVFFIMRIIIQQTMSYFLTKYPGRYFNFQWVAFWDESNQAVMGFIVFVFTVRFLRLLAFNKKISMLANVLENAMKPLGGFMICFMIMFFAFAQCGYLMFFKNVDAFKSFAWTVETLGVMSLNKFDFTTFAVGGGKLGLGFFFIYMVFVSFILINFFITIITISFEQVKESWAERENKYELIDYITRKFKKFFGLDGGPDKFANMDSRFAYIAQEVDIDREMDKVDEKVAILMDKLSTLIKKDDDLTKDILNKTPKKSKAYMSK